MLRNFITIALRQFRRNLTYTLINVMGLSLGLAGSFVIGSWVVQELSYDKHFKNYEQIYRVSVSFYNSEAFARGPEILNNVLNDQAPEVKASTRLVQERSIEIQIDKEKFEEVPFYVDSGFFKVFSYEFLHGNPKTVLSQPNNVVIDADLAQKYFGTQDAIGKSILIGDENTAFQVAGVIQTKGQRSHIEAKLFLPLELKGNQNWTSARYFDYVMLHDGVSERDLILRLKQIKKDYVYGAFNSDVPYEEWSAKGLYDFYTVPLQDIHLNPPMRFDMSEGGNRANVYVFLIVAIFLVTIAAINFINLSTAQSAKRAKEVGVRKALGTARPSLIVQYLTESVMMSLLALLFGIGLAEIFLILFQQFTNEQLISGLFTAAESIGIYVAFGLLIGLMAGIYPAFYLSKFKPIDILKSQSLKVKSAGFRNVLVVVQFTVSIALIICSLFVYQQLQYLRLADLGFDRENVLVINNVSALEKNQGSFKEQLLQHSAVEYASFNKRVPAGSSVWLYTFKSKEMEEGKGFQTFIGDDQYLKTMGFRLLEGRNFSKDIASDSTAVILSASAARELLLTEPVVGTTLQEGYHVIGVVADFSYQNYTEKPAPVVITYNPEGYRLSIKLKGNQIAEFIAYMQQQWQNLSPEAPINYAFVDDNFEKLMEKDKTLSTTVSFFTTIAIFISSLGLFGLAAFTSQQRQKEIGIRKVLGATVTGVIVLLNKSFTRLVIIAVLLAIPIAWYLMSQWLQNFVYKTDLNVFTFLISGLLALAIAWSTVGFLSYRAASTNPVDSLRDE